MSEDERDLLEALLVRGGRIALDANSEPGRQGLLIARVLADRDLVELQADVTNPSVTHCEITKAGRAAYRK